MITVTKTFLPGQDEYNAILKTAWDNQWITNRGALTISLEIKLAAYLGVPNIIATTNGTLPLQIAIKALNLKGEIITTPFSYVATAAAIAWENCIPVFVDIDEVYLTIDETKIEAAITENTVAILATHVFGNPCNVKIIEAIANKHQLKVIYDAAHCFGVKYNGSSVFNYGDVSTCSFHATKLFHTGEGGAIFCNDAVLFHNLFYMHNFGHDGPLKFHGPGINAKITELQAAMGLAVLPYMSTIINERKKVVDYYDSQFKNSIVQRLKLRDGTEWNYSYYPIILPNEDDLLQIEQRLISNSILPRRYFYPSLNTIAYLKGKEMPVSESISKRILCLPLYVGLTETDLAKICRLVLEDSQE